MARLTTAIAAIGLTAALGSSVSTINTPVLEESLREPIPEFANAPRVEVTEPPRAVVADRAVLPGISGANEDQRILVEASLGRFAEAGLDLPPLEIHIHGTKDGCMGNNGLYRSGGEIERIDICHVSEFVILHELAHAWDFNHSTEQVRSDFLEAAGLTHWSGEDVPWLDRGAERAANVVATTLASESTGSCGDSASDLMEILAGSDCVDEG